MFGSQLCCERWKAVLEVCAFGRELRSELKNAQRFHRQQAVERGTG